MRETKRIIKSTRFNPLEFSILNRACTICDFISVGTFMRETCLKRAMAIIKKDEKNERI